ncbi:MAG: hypothetical protein SA339_12150 [Methanomassiliicoccus sp.]|nr:hypothetical protein [Methanomassiliicoccus sp.]
MISGAEERKFVSIQLRLSPKQAARLEKLYLVFGLTKSDVTDAALEEFFKIGQEEIMKRVAKRPPGRYNKRAGK